jgi:hypothetical protein
MHDVACSLITVLVSLNAVVLFGQTSRSISTRIKPARPQADDENFRRNSDLTFRGLN